MCAEVLRVHPLRVSITSTESTSLQLSMTRYQDVPTILINATTLEVSSQGTFSISIFQATDFPEEGNICISGLRPGTFYNVCVTPVLEDESRGLSVCVQQTTTVETESSSLSGCVQADKVVETTQQTPSELESTLNDPSQRKKKLKGL